MHPKADKQCQEEKTSLFLKLWDTDTLFSLECLDYIIKTAVDPPPPPPITWMKARNPQKLNKMEVIT